MIARPPTIQAALMYGLEPFVTRGDLLLDEDEQEPLESPLRGIPSEAWTKFVRGMITAPLSSVSASNALGLFEIMPRRLEDLGVVKRLTRSKSECGRTIYVATFAPPFTCDQFLRSPEAQYGVFCRSMKRYYAGICEGEIEKDPDMSMSGALAILHRCGPKGLQTWASGERFPSTQASYERVAEVF